MAIKKTGCHRIRAVSAADGWTPYGLNLEQLRAMLNEARSTPEWAPRQERGECFEVMLAPPPTYDITRPQRAAELVNQIAGYRDAGATIINLFFPSQSLADYLEQVALFKERLALRFS